MTIITRGDSGGKKRRCDGSCHNAKGPKCACVCGGRYHGAGAMAQDRLTSDWLGNDWREKQAVVEAAGGSFVAAITGALRQAMEAR